MPDRRPGRRGPARRRPALLVALLVLIGCAATLPGPVPESAASGPERGTHGTVSVEVSKRALRKLRKAGIKLTSKGAATHPRRRLIVIPVRGGTTGAVAQMKLAGQVRFEAAGRHARSHRTARMRRLAAVLSNQGGYLTGRLRGKQYTLFELPDIGSAPFDPLTGVARVRSAGTRIPRLTRQAVKAHLRSPALPARLGRTAVEAALEPVSGEQTSPPVRERPAGAVDLSSATVTWRARPSWVDYLHDAPGDLGGATARGGATDGPVEVIPPSSEARVYQFDLPFTGGWYDAATGTAEIETAGTVNYFKLIDPFQIDLDADDAEIELGGERPRMIATINGRRNNADQRNRRAVVVDLAEDAVTPAVTGGPDGTTFTYGQIPAVVPEGADTWPVAGYYQPGSDWGWVSVSFTVGAAP